MENEARRCTITIFGSEYALVTNESEQHLERAAQIVDTIMNEIAHRVPAEQVGKIAVLTALRLSSQLQTLQKGQQDIEGNIKELLDALESDLK